MTIYAATGGVIFVKVLPTRKGLGWGDKIMNRYQEMMKKRNDRQLSRLDAMAEDVRNLAKKEGVKVRFYGSYARRAVHPGSDLDVLIIDDLDTQRRRKIMYGIERLASIHQVEVDMVEASFAPHLAEDSIS